MRMLLAAALALGACAEEGGTDAPEAAPPVTTAQAAAGAPAASGEARFPVAVATRDGAPTAAACVAEGAGFRAEFAAPTVLAVPTFGPGTGGVSIVCASGGLRWAVRAEPVARRAGGAGGWPAIGIGVSGGGGTSVSVGGYFGGGPARGPESFIVRYPAVEVTLSPAARLE